MFFTGQEILDFLSHWGYGIVLPLMIIEGPVATILAAMLASFGVFNAWVVLIFSILGDVVGDLALYWVGKVWGMKFVDRVGKYIGISRRLVLRMKKHFDRHGGKTIFLVKSTIGLGWATFVAAGIAKMSFGKFVGYSFLGGIVWSGFLVAMGYFYGYMWQQIKQYIEWAGLVSISLAIITFAGITLYKRYKSKELLTK